jgi:uncharacterized RDD family membrane protein YckC
MSDPNPYAPPKADLSFFKDFVPDAELARRLTRLAAAFVDGIISLAYAIPLMYLLRVWTYVTRQQEPPFLLIAASSGLSFIGFCLIHGYFLKKSGQTLGKKLTGIHITDLDGNVPNFATVILLRYLPISLVALIPGVGPWLSLIDVLSIFGEERRCVHDLIAGTKVVIASKHSNPGLLSA